jgi:hypothetical protein
MARTGPFYSSKLHRYHDQTLCTEGGAIEPENLVRVRAEDRSVTNASVLP